MKLEEVVLHYESCPIDKLLFQVVQNAAGEVYDKTAVGAYEVVMMLGRPSEEITAGIAFIVHLAYEPQGGQHLERAIYGDQSDAGVFAVGSFIKLGRGDVIVAFGDGVDYSTTLGG